MNEVPHVVVHEDCTYADTAALRALQAAGWGADHMGFGDFRLICPGGGVVEFVRRDGHPTIEDLADWTGRPHALIGTPKDVNAVAKVIREAGS